MPKHNQIYGQAGESLAVAYLARQGYRILERNYRTLLGEIDVIAQHGQSVVFIEVKTRRSESFASVKYAVTEQKQKKISMVALAYLKSKGQMHRGARFDVVTIVDPMGSPKIDHIPNAFDLAY
jgi:putative endonuclease